MGESDPVNHPDHYGGGDNPYEIIKIINALDLNFNLGNSFKYLARAGKKDPAKHVEDLDKAIFYLKYERDIVAGERKF
jgi:hypothetical protein